MSASRTSTGGFTALPNVDAEINLVAGIALSVEAHPNTLIQGGATNKEMAQALKSVDIVHTACHGVQNAVDPLRSAFHLNDNRKLTVSDLKHARLAFLSARETAKGDRKKPNQVIHLAATMLFVGFKSDVGTVW
jgi:CHAT domain-containing protein